MLAFGFSICVKELDHACLQLPISVIGSENGFVSSCARYQHNCYDPWLGSTLFCVYGQGFLSVS